MRIRSCLMAACIAALVAPAAAQPASPARGELLYGTHCIACHREQMHWRDKRVAVDWPTLKQQVALWQGRALLGWSDEDVTEVARYLNDTIYRYPVDSGQRAAASPR
jgi:hypothetical protein